MQLVKAKESCNAGGMIKVETFLPQNPVLLLRIFPGQTRVSDVKRAISSELHLFESSLNIFGLYYGGSLGNPKRLLQNYSLLSQNMMEMFFFQRLSFSREKEEICIRKDYRALELLFWEVTDQICTHTVCPPLTENQKRILKRLLDDERHSNLSCNRKKVMLQAIDFVDKNCGLYYWGLYYRTENCTLRGLLVTAASPSITQGSRVHVALGSQGVTFISPKRCAKCEGIIAKFPWNKVRSVSTDKERQVVILNVLVENVEEELATKILRAIPLETSDFEYIYSIALHTLNIQDEI